LRDKTIGERFKAVGTSTFPEADWTREAHQKRLLAEIDKWAVAMKAAGQAPQAAK
jgi:hypothetical protein